MMKKKVIIALDYNPSSQKIAEAGYKMAKDFQAEVYLVHVLADPTYYYSREYSPIIGFNAFSGVGVSPVITIDELKKAALEFLEKSKENLGDPSIKTILKESDAAEGILEAAQEVKASFIVIGTHGRRGWDKILMGSVAENVLKESTIPLFIIPTRSLEKE